MENDNQAVFLRKLSGAMAMHTVPGPGTDIIFIHANARALAWEKTDYNG